VQEIRQELVQGLQGKVASAVRSNDPKCMFYQGGIDAVEALFQRIEDDSGTPETP